MINTIIIQPILNLLVFIYAILPGHDFGLAIIIFTLIIRLLLWPLIKKQLHHTKKLREIQPELKKIKAAAKGDRQKEAAMTMALYKEREVSPFSTIGLTILQLPILIGLYVALEHLIANPEIMVKSAYPFVRDLSWIQQIKVNPSLFDPHFLNLVNLKTAALSPAGHWYIPGLILVTGSAIAQYFQSKQLLPTTKESKGLKQILSEASSGKKADQADMQAATGKFTSFIIPFFIFFITLRIASALLLYWFVGGLIAYWQQARVLNQDEAAAEAVANQPNKVKNSKTGTSQAKEKAAIEAEIVKKPKNKNSVKKTKRRKR